MTMIPGQDYVAPSSTGNGYVVVVGGKPVGTYTSLNDAQNAYNGAPGSPGPQSSPSSGGGQTYQTSHAGPQTLSAMTAWLQSQNAQGVNYSDPNSVLAAYNGAYNANPGGGATPSSTNPGSMQALLNAIASGDTQAANQAIAQFNTNALEGSRQFGINTALKQQEDYSNLVDSMLKTAASLRGPQDYFQYQKMLSGGKNLFQQLYGNNPNPAFQTPAGQITPVSIESILQQLGVQQSPQMPTSIYNPVNNSWTTPPAAPSPAAAPAGVPATGATSTTGSMVSSPPPPNTPVFDKGGRVNGPIGSHILAILQAGEKVVPAKNKGASAGKAKRDAKTGLPVYDQGGMVQATLPQNAPTSNASSNMNLSLPTFGGTSLASPQTSAPTPANNIPSISQTRSDFGGSSPLNFNALSTGSNALVPSATPPTPKVPLPYQINPAVWDSMGPTGQAMALSAAEAAGWDKNDYLYQINASRPVGTAPAYSIASYYTPVSQRASTEGMFGVY